MHCSYTFTDVHEYLKDFSLCQTLSKAPVHHINDATTYSGPNLSMLHANEVDEDGEPNEGVQINWKITQDTYRRRIP